MSTIALCIPAYNAQDCLPRLLQSAAVQSIPFDEIWVYNDGSTDYTEKVALTFGARVINGPVNKGCAHGKNILADATSCDWIHFHDADDDLLPEFSDRAHAWINDYSAHYDVLLLNFSFIDFKTGKILGTANHNAEELHQDALKYAIKNKIVNFGLYRRTAFLAAGGFDLDEQVLYNEDNALHQRLAKRQLRFDYLPQITCINYRYDLSMSSSNLEKCSRANYYVLAKTAASHGQVYPSEITEQLWICATSLAAVQDWAFVKKCLLLGKQLNPRYMPGGNLHFKLLAKINPCFAFWFREKMIRLFKAYLRK
jgi:glycosyltransferase involved in cell wall biosynthesis